MDRPRCRARLEYGAVGCERLVTPISGTGEDRAHRPNCWRTHEPRINATRPRASRARHRRASCLRRCVRPRFHGLLRDRGCVPRRGRGGRPAGRHTAPSRLRRRPHRHVHRPVAPLRRHSRTCRHSSRPHARTCRGCVRTRSSVRHRSSTGNGASTSVVEPPMRVMPLSWPPPRPARRAVGAELKGATWQEPRHRLLDDGTQEPRTPAAPHTTPDREVPGLLRAMRRVDQSPPRDRMTSGKLARDLVGEIADATPPSREHVAGRRVDVLGPDVACSGLARGRSVRPGPRRARPRCRTCPGRCRPSRPSTGPVGRHPGTTRDDGVEPSGDLERGLGDVVLTHLVHVEQAGQLVGVGSEHESSAQRGRRRTVEVGQGGDGGGVQDDGEVSGQRAGDRASAVARSRHHRAGPDPRGRRPRARSRPRAARRPVRR